jgi:hypothetical protein
MSAPANGVYLVSIDGARIPLKRSALEAIRRMVMDKATGSVILSFKSGGHAGTKAEQVYAENVISAKTS